MVARAAALVAELELYLKRKLRLLMALFWSHRMRTNGL